jgi:hypothetical protein
MGGSFGLFAVGRARGWSDLSEMPVHRAEQEDQRDTQRGNDQEAEDARLDVVAG